MAVGVDGGLCAGLSAVILRVGTFSQTPTTRPSSATRPRFVAVPSCVVGLNDDAYDGVDIGNVHLSPV